MNTHRVAKRDYFAVVNIKINISVRDFETLNELAGVEVGDAGRGVGVRVLSEEVRVSFIGILCSELVYELECNVSRLCGLSDV
jgi:hypothetical protein